jgi:hypothetical protein
LVTLIAVGFCVRLQRIYNVTELTTYIKIMVTKMKESRIFWLADFVINCPWRRKRRRKDNIKTDLSETDCEV